MIKMIFMRLHVLPGEALIHKLTNTIHIYTYNIHGNKMKWTSTSSSSQNFVFPVVSQQVSTLSSLFLCLGQSVWSCCCLQERLLMFPMKMDSHLYTSLQPTATAGELVQASPPSSPPIPYGSLKPQPTPSTLNLIKQNYLNKSCRSSQVLVLICLYPCYLILYIWVRQPPWTYHV